MTNTTTKVGIMPGKLEEFVFEAGTTVAKALEIAGLNPAGYEVKADGNVVELDGTIEGFNVILLTKKVKGNANVTKVGVMPGKLEEFIFEEGTTVAKALEIAGLNPSGYEVKADGQTIDLDATLAVTNVLLLTKKVKGNSSTTKVGIMPGKLEEFVFDDDTTVSQALDIAGLNPSGYEVKADGNVVELDDTATKYNVILLTKKVKGNK